MNILLIGNDAAVEDANDYYAGYRTFFEQAIARSTNDADVAITYLDDLFISFGDGTSRIVDTRTGHDIKEFDIVFLRGKGFREKFDVLRAISSYTASHGVKQINDYRGIHTSSKLIQAVEFVEMNKPVASSVLVNRALFARPDLIPFGFPCIMKDVYGAHGENNYLVTSLEEVSSYQQQHHDRRFVLQRFVLNDGDFRVLVVGNEVMVIGRQSINGSHLNNTSQGGVPTIIEQATLPAGLIDDARDIARQLRMTIAGVDAIIDRESGEYFFLEVNSQPQLISGAFVDDKNKLVADFFSALS